MITLTLLFLLFIGLVVGGLIFGVIHILLTPIRLLIVVPLAILAAIAYVVLSVLGSAGSYSSLLFLL